MEHTEHIFWVVLVGDFTDKVFLLSLLSPQAPQGTELMFPAANSLICLLIWFRDKNIEMGVGAGVGGLIFVACINSLRPSDAYMRQ